MIILAVGKIVIKLSPSYHRFKNMKEYIKVKDLINAPIKTVIKHLLKY